MTDAINVNETIARLTQIEAERDELLATLRAAGDSISEVLKCFAPDAATTPAPAAKKKPAAKKPTATSAPRACVDETLLSAAVALVAAGQAKDVEPRVLLAAKRKGLIVCEGRGRGATYRVAG